MLALTVLGIGYCTAGVDKRVPSTSFYHCRQCSIVLKPRSDRIDHTVVRSFALWRTTAAEYCENITVRPVRAECGECSLRRTIRTHGRHSSSCILMWLIVIGVIVYCMLHEINVWPLHLTAAQVHRSVQRSVPLYCSTVFILAPYTILRLVNTL